METVKLEFDIGTTDAECKLGARVTLDGVVVYDNPHVTTTDHVSQDISEQDGDHVLEIELYGKLSEHTKISSTGEILSDALIIVENINADGIDLSQIVPKLIEYHHDFNGTQQSTMDKFYGVLGCNGVARLKFTTPIYLWLLENM